MLPKSFVPCGGASGEAETPRGSAPVSVPVMSYAIQWTKPDASGSSSTRTRAPVPSGAPDQARSGDTSSPSQVNRAGIGPPGGNAVVVSSKLAGIGVSDGDVAGLAPGDPLAACDGGETAAGDAVAVAAVVGEAAGGDAAGAT